MSDFFESSAFLGVAVSLLSYALGSFLKKKFKTGIFNPLLISIVITIVFLLLIIVNIIFNIISFDGHVNIISY